MYKEQSRERQRVERSKRTKIEQEEGKENENNKRKKQGVGIYVFDSLSSLICWRDNETRISIRGKRSREKGEEGEQTTGTKKSYTYHRQGLGV